MMRSESAAIMGASPARPGARRRSRRMRQPARNTGCRTTTCWSRSTGKARRVQGGGTAARMAAGGPSGRRAARRPKARRRCGRCRQRCTPPAARRHPRA
ncbi:hypothetical protein WR25_27025 [Diploscapter pachys]|uniref:Uncharacterized protein n=1 Tax=Diploscapter pachys TaxID=2018661 RepID=A0A2A2M546_9BILA|nr:hypothetical protein WR25_27025 [Diploscapter pachys]